MCGIVGVIGPNPAAPLLLEALRRLEYRGYDSAGIATLVNGHIDRRRAPGKLVNLAAVLERAPLAGTTGIGHTRWATHGAPTEGNAHPHGTSASPSSITASSRTTPSCAPSWSGRPAIHHRDRYRNGGPAGRSAAAARRPRWTPPARRCGNWRAPMRSPWYSPAIPN